MEISNKALQQFGEYLGHKADDTGYWQIVLNGKPVSFSGRRVFKTESAAKTQLTFFIKKKLHLAKDESRNPNKKVRERLDPITSIWVEEWKEHLGRGIQGTDTKQFGKELTKSLIECGIVTFEQI